MKKQANPLLMHTLLMHMMANPIEAAGMVAAGKIMASNALHRFGEHIAPFRWLGKEIAGVGARTGMQGKPMLSKPFRNLAAVGLDPQLTSLYENAHRAGKLMGPETAQQLPSVLGQLQHHPALQEMVGAKNLKMLHDVPLQSTGLRKVVDYGFTPRLTSSF